VTRKKIESISPNEGMEVCQNFIKPHEGSEGKTLPEACGIVVNGKIGGGL
jgi:hypothetical protein